MKQRFGLLALLTALACAAPAYAQDDADNTQAAAGTEEAGESFAAADDGSADAGTDAGTDGGTDAGGAYDSGAEVEAAAAADSGMADSFDSGMDEGGEEGEQRRPSLLRTDTWFMSPTVEFIYADDDRGTDDGIGATFTLGRRMTPGLNLGLTALYSAMSSDARIMGLGASAEVHWLSRYPRLYMPAKLLYGRVKDHPGPVDSYHTTIFDVGLGYYWPLAGGSLLRTEALYRVDAHGKNNAGTTRGENKHFYDGVFNVGLVIPFGGDEPQRESNITLAEPACPPAPEGAAVDERGCMLDADGDGVADNLDQCPDTPVGTAVNAQGCPIDSDGDGIPDEIDECPRSPAGAKVLANGCALQGDCRKPRPGEQVDENGCAAEQKFILKGVKFEFDSDRLTEEAKQILVDVAETLKSYDSIRVELQGHTDYIGTDAYNLGLSERRARAVRTFLIGQGVDGNRMVSVGYGEAQPVDSNETEQGRENNRRVELKVIE